MKPQRQVIGLALSGAGLILAGIAVWVLFADATSAQGARSGDFAAIPVNVEFKAPSLTLRDLDGAEHSLSDYLGQIVLANLWATWCPPCTAEMPAYERFYQRHRKEGFIVVAINDGEAARDVELFVAEHGLTFPVWLDPKYEATDRAFKTGNLPTSYVIDRAGTVRLMWIGAISTSNLDKYVTPLIKE